MKIKSLFVLLTLFLFSCNTEKKQSDIIELEKPSQYITVLGIAQDGGFPHIGCQKECCTNYYNGTFKKKKVVSLDSGIYLVKKELLH